MSMSGGYFLVLCGLLWLSTTDAGLTADQKQAILDKHNTLRREEGASNMNELVTADFRTNYVLFQKMFENGNHK